MSAVAAALAGLVVAVLVGRRPAPARCRRLADDRARSRADDQAGARRSPLAVIGAPVVARLPRPSAPRGQPPTGGDPCADVDRSREVGAAITVGVPLLLLGGPITGLLGAASAALAFRVVHRRQAPRGGTAAPAARRLDDDLPEVIDLLGLAVGAGLTVPAALAVITPVAPRSLRADLQVVLDAIDAGSRLEDAVARLGPRWGDAGRPLVRALLDHLRYGTPVLDVLGRVAAEARVRRRRAAEVRARRLPVLLLFPLVLCTLPAFGLLTVAPLVAGTLDSLEGSPLEAPASATP